MNSTTWHPLKGFGGQQLALDGIWAAAATDHRLSLWRGEELVGEYQGEHAARSKPVFAHGNLHWGAGMLELNARKYETFSADYGDQSATDILGFPRPDGMYRLAQLQWSQDGQYLIAAYLWRGSGEEPGKVLLFNKQYQFMRILWTGDASEIVLWSDGTKVVIGTSKLTILDMEGKALETKEMPLPIHDLASSANSQRMLIVLHNELKVMDGEWKEELLSVKGFYLNAAVSNDGKLVAGVTQKNELQLIEVESGKTQELKVPAPLSSVGLGYGVLLGKFGLGIPMQRTTY